MLIACGGAPLHPIACPQRLPAPPAGELEALQECTIGLGAGDQKEMLSRMLSKIAALEGAVAAAEARRRDIHNQLMELKGNVSGTLVLYLLGRCMGVVGGSPVEGGEDSGHGRGGEEGYKRRATHPLPACPLPHHPVVSPPPPPPRPNPRSAVQCLPDGLTVRLQGGPDGKDHSFAYDKVFRPEASQVR